MTKILMVAAASMEFPGILAHATGVRPAGLAVDWSRFATIGDNEFLLAANGAGVRRAAAAVDAALAGFRPDAVVSTGFCGALSPELAIADIVVGDSVAAGPLRFPALPPRASRPHRTGAVASIDHVAGTAAEKRQLHAGGAIAVEMEAAGVAARAAAAAIPFYCIRAVSDLAGEDMANDFNKALREDGHFDTMGVLLGTLRAPLVRLPELFRLRQRCARAARVLGEFIADCRF
ncbi:MAG: hypothetical protein JST11_20890 [Acidobacteria bacterium]|nr:hypothetical protein [Acidobacteriota bacterium]